jgi:pSer/pThr/pTyr-binding forkhead associated (FHA) protein
MTADPMKPASYLVYEAERRAYPLNDSPFSIGRDANSDIIIREPAVSRSHAEVRPDADGFVLTATGATGTRLNGTPITTAAKLSDGDRIEIGSVEITYREGRLPLGVSVVDTATTPTHVSDVMTRRPTITNPILGGGQAAPGKKKSAVWTLLLLLILIGAATWYFFGR